MFKVRDGGKVINRTVYIFVGLNKEGKKRFLDYGLVRQRVLPSGWVF